MMPKMKMRMNMTLDYGGGFWAALIGAICTNISTMLYLRFKKMELAGPPSSGPPLSSG